MALVLKDRVKETTTTTGTGTYTLAGAVTGFEAFSSVGDGNTTYYSCTDGTDFEVGIGTYTASGTTLARTTILQSSNSDSAVSWSSGTKTIFCAQPAEKAVFLDANGDITLTGASYNLSEFLNFGDSGAPNFDNRLRFGDGVDLSLFSDGTNGFLQGANNNDLFVAYDEIHLLSQDYSKTRIKINSSDAVELYHDNVKKLETTADGVTITSTDAGAGEGPTLELFRDSASPADSDSLGNIKFTGDDSAGNKTQYAEIESRLVNTTDGSENGRLIFRVNDDGSSTSVVDIAFDRVAFNESIYLASSKNIQFEGSGSDDANETTLTVTDPTADRTITLPDATGTVLLTDGSGASLTSLNASQLSSGTVPNARLDAQLQDVAGLAVTNGGFIVGDGSNFVLETGATARTSLGLGTVATEDTGVSGNDIPKFSSAGVSDDDFLRIDGTRVEGRSASEVLSDIGATTAADAANEATALAIALG